MAMGTRKKRQRQENLWYGGELATAPGHPFYTHLNEVLDGAGFDSFCETQSARFYHQKLGRPSLPPGHPFYTCLNEVLDGAGFDSFCETQSARFYHQKLGRPSLPPGHPFYTRLNEVLDGAG